MHLGKVGLRHINDQALVENITLAETLYARYRESLQQSQEADVLDGIIHAFAQASEKLPALLPETMRKLEAYILARPEEFLTERTPAVPA